MKFKKAFSVAAAALIGFSVTALELNAPGTTVVPSVKSSVPLDGKFRIPADFRVCAPEKCEMALEMLGEALKTRGAKLTTVSGDAVCVFTIDKNAGFRSPEAYTIIISPDNIRVTAASDRGLFYAAQTLIPMIRAAKDDLLACQRIDDHPDLKVRGMHFTLRWLNPQNMAYFKSVVRALASLKYNTLLLEFGDNFPYEDNPFTLREKAPEGVKEDPHFRGLYPRPGYTLTRADLEDLTKWIKDHKISIIPQIQLATHVRLLATHPRFKSFLEAPTKVNTYHDAASCPSNDEVNGLFKKMIREQLEFFKPEVFDLCFDEFDLVPFRVCPKCKARKPEEIIKSLLDMAYEEIFAAGAVPQIYHDTFLPGTVSNGSKVLPHLDRRTILTFWSYVEQPTPHHLKFHSLGFPVITMPLSAYPENVDIMTKFAKQEDLRGTIMTFWYHWFHMGPNLKPRSAAGYGGFVSSAELCWNPGGNRELLPCDYVNEMLFRLGTPNKKVDAPGNWKSLPLGGAVNAELGDNRNFPVFVMPGRLDKLKKTAANAPEKFELLTEGRHYYGILLAGSRQDPNQRRGKLIGVNAKVKEFAFLLTASQPDNILNFTQRGKYSVHAVPAVASVTLNYADNTKHTANFRYRDSITDWANEYGGLRMRHLNRDADDHGSVYNFGVTRVVNPHPEKQVDTIVFSTASHEGIAPLLLAVSAVTDRNYAPQKINHKLVTVKSSNIQVKAVDLFNSKTDSARKINVRLVTGGKKPKDFLFPNRLLKSRIATDENGAKALRFTVPAMPQNASLQRVIVQLPLKNSIAPGNRSINWTFRLHSPSQHKYYGIFIGRNNPAFPHISFFDHSQSAPVIQSKSLSFDDMRKEGLKSLNDADNIWISFWLINTRPVEIDIYQIGVSNTESKYQLSTFKSDVL